MMQRLFRTQIPRACLFFVLVCSLAVPPSVPAAQSKPENIRDAKIALDVKGMNIVDVLKILADEGGLNLSVSGNVQGRITLFLKDINVWDAFEIVIISGELAYEQRGDILYIMTEREYELKYGDRYWDNRQMKVFGFKHGKAAKAGSIFSQVASKIGKVIVDEATNTVIVIDIPAKIKEMESVAQRTDRPLETRVFQLNYLPVTGLQEKLTPLLSPEAGSMKTDELTNKIAVTDYPERLQDIERIITAFDEKPLQVLIDAKIIEIKPTKNFYSGVDWHYWLQKYFEVQGVFDIPTASTDKITVGAISNDDVTRKGDYSSVAEFLETFGETRVLSTPRILALNNQEAKILVGAREAYITETISQADNSSVTAQTVNFVDVGVKLYVTPTINHAGYVTLKIRPEISSAEKETLIHQDRRTEIPIVSTSEAETTIIVRDGVNIILGGLRKVTREKETKQVPILGSIPFFGMFFGSKKDEWAKNELVIVLVPHIVSGDKAIEYELREKEETLMQQAAQLELEMLNERQKKKETVLPLPAASQPVSVDLRPIELEATIKEADNLNLDTSLYETQTLRESRRLGPDQMWERQAIEEYQREKAAETPAADADVEDLELLRQRLAKEQLSIDSFLAEPETEAHN